ncbi:MAG TPA: CvpA family protein [Anaerolineaceae bacterium]
MISLNVIFWIYVVFFALIGAMRGWAKELLVAFAVILSLFIIAVLERFVPFIRDNLAVNSQVTLFWIRVIILFALVFFGYQSPNIPRLAGSNRFARERLQDILLGLFLGAVNGYLVVGTLLFYLHDAKYPFPIITPPQPNTPMGQATLQLISYMPPHWMGTPVIYFAVAVAFAFVLVVFI